MSIIAITGANRGLGLEFCKQLKERGDEPIAICRTPSPELTALEIQVIDGVDLTSAHDLKKISKKLNHVVIDLLIQNAGVLIEDQLGEITAENLRQQFELNAIAPIMLSQELLPNLKEGSKIAFITSRMGSIQDNTSGGYYGYRASKAALNMAGYSLSIEMKKKGIAVGLFHPGYVRTKMTEFHGTMDPPESVKGLLREIDMLNIESTGCFRHSNGQKLPW